MALVLLNGSIVGVHRNAPALVDAYRRLRRAGLVGEFVSVTLDGPTVHIASDGGRVCRPLIICDAGVPRVTAAHTAKARPPADALALLLPYPIAEALLGIVTWLLAPTDASMAASTNG